MVSFLWLGNPSFQFKSPLQFESARKASTGEVTWQSIEVQFKHGRQLWFVKISIYPRLVGGTGKWWQNCRVPLIHNKILPFLEWKATCCLSKGTTYWLLLYILMQRTLGSSLLCSGWKSVFHLSPVGQTLKKKNVFVQPVENASFFKEIGARLLWAKKGWRYEEYWVAYCQALKKC